LPQIELTINHTAGLHARPASLFVQTANKFSSEIIVSYSGKNVNAKSILGVLTLGAQQGAVISIRVSGADAEEALGALKELVENNFQIEGK
jgi:phosphotransferase system HPr (HPr) family protein